MLAIWCWKKKLISRPTCCKCSKVDTETRKTQEEKYDTYGNEYEVYGKGNDVYDTYGYNGSTQYGESRKPTTRTKSAEKDVELTDTNTDYVDLGE